jgi:hypothetical protein
VLDWGLLQEVLRDGGFRGSRWVVGVARRLEWCRGVGLYIWLAPYWCAVAESRSCSILEKILINVNLKKINIK